MNPYLQDSVGAVWQVSVTDSGLLQTILSPGILSYSTSLPINDLSGQQTWNLTVLSSGLLHITQAGFNGSAPTQIALQSSFLFTWNLQVSSGLLQTTNGTSTNNQSSGNQPGGLVGTFNSNILPATVGLNLGSLDQKWDAFIQTLTGDTWQSTSLSVAQSGSIRLAARDFIAWRNETDDGDVTLTKGTDGALAFEGTIQASRFRSSDGPMPDAGSLQLAKNNSINWRNEADTADIEIFKNSADNLVFNTGIVSSSLTSSTIPSAGAGKINLANQEAIYWRNFFNNGDIGIFVDSGDRLRVTTTNGMLLDGSQVYFGGTSSANAKLTIAFGGNALWSRLADNSDNADFVCKTLHADSIQANSIPLIDLGSQGASIGSTSIDATNQGFYLVWYYLSVSRAATSSSSILVTFTWPSGDAAGTVTAVSATLNSNVLGDYKSGTVLVRSNGGSGILYSTTYASSGGTSMQYRLTISALRIA